MSKTGELEVMDKMITIEGVRVTRTAMVFTRLDEVSLRRAGHYLQAVDACSAWWWGDYLAAYCGYEIKAEEEENGPMDELTKGDRLKQYSAKYAAIANKEPKTLWQYLWVARFYNSSCRQEELTWTHHVEATVGAEGDVAKAQAWLDAAIKHRWSASELRAAIRKTKRADEEERDGPPAQSVLPMEYVEARRRSTSDIARVADMPEEEARALFVELASVAKLWHALGERLGMATLPGTPGAKESLSRSA